MKRSVPVLFLLFAVLAPQAWGYAPSPLESGIAPVMEQSIYREHTFQTGERTGPLVPWESILYNPNQLVCSRYWRVTEPTGEYFSYVRDTRLGGPLADPNYGASTWTPITRTEVEQGQRLEFLAAVPVMLLYLDSAGAVVEVEAGANLKPTAVTRPEPCLPTAPKTQLSLPAPKQPVALLPEAAESLAAKTGLTTPGNVPLGFTRVELPAGSFVNRVYDSSCVPGKSQLFGQSFCPGAGLPTDAAYAITTRGLNPALNNAQLGAVFRVSQNITVY